MSSYQCHEGEVCFYCDAVVSPRHEHDHAPIPLRHGGAETVVACLNCHDLKDRLALRNWPASLVMEGWGDMSPAARLLTAKVYLIGLQRMEAIA